MILELTISAIIGLVLGACFHNAIMDIITRIVYVVGYPYFKWKYINDNKSIKEKMEKILKRPKYYVRKHNKRTTNDIINEEELIRRAELCIKHDKMFALLPNNIKYPENNSDLDMYNFS